ncbi:MAG: efflux RND transporter periplasmic adaptor subunit [Gemmatimonadetes bacterium]|nr:efflux RND transporter periplasmic adaptor subunit [Gemmatimonadota bacterium]
MTRPALSPRPGRLPVPVLLLALFAVLLAAGTLPRLARARARDAERAAVQAPATVYTEVVRRDTAGTALELPGSVTGAHETAVYARSSGYVTALRVDIGSAVRRGETLAVLDMPEVREQAAQAAAVAEQAEASAALARTALARWQQLAAQGVVSPQELDERTAAANVTEANARAARANLANLRETLRFGALVAPYPGLVTARTIDLGSLVTAGTAAGARPLLTVVQLDTVRIMVQVPQSAAARVRVGMRPRILARDLGKDAEFTGTVVRTAGAMDPATRTLLVEVQVPNPQRRLLPGMFTAVQLKVPGTGASLRLPAIALIVRAEGTLAARVERDTVRLVPVTLGRDFGTTVEVLEGLAPGDAVVVNPPESLEDGQLVRAIARGKPAKGG